MEVKGILKQRRIELGYTMKQIADKVGVSEGTISRWESGDIANMRRDKIWLLSKALEISPAVIMGWADKPEKKEYYLDPEAATIAQAVYDDPELRTLFDAARDVKPENIRLAAEMLKRMKETNPDG